MRFLVISVIAFVSSQFIYVQSYEDIMPPELFLATKWQSKVLTPRSAQQRSVWFVQSVYANMGNVAMSGVYQGQMIFPIDAAVFFTGTATDAPLMINLVSWNGSIAIHVHTWPLNTTGSIPSLFGSNQGVTQRKFFVANTTLTNLEIWNPNGKSNNTVTSASLTPGMSNSTGSSAHQASATAPITGSLHPNGTLLHNTKLKHRAEPVILKRQSVPIKQKRRPSDAEIDVLRDALVLDRYENALEESLEDLSKFEANFVQVVQSSPSTFKPASEADELLQTAIKQVEISNVQEPLHQEPLHRDMFIVEDTEEDEVRSAYALSLSDSAVSEVPIDEMPKAAPVSLVQANTDDRILPIIGGDDQLSTKISLADADSPEAQAGSAEEKGGEAQSATSMTKADGKLTIATTVTLAAAKILDFAQAITCVIIDFTEGHWRVGVVSAVGLGLTIASIVLAATFETLSAIIGPLGFLLAAFAQAFIKVNPKPPVNNSAQIIQWSFFGDKDTTGNMNCKNLSAPANESISGNTSCPAHYGAGTLALTLKLTNFDATVLSIWANDGYGISIPELATKMCVMDNVARNQCPDAPFRVDCRNTIGIPGPHGTQIEGDDFTLCNRPTYDIQTNLINLPVLNQTADKIERRIIGGPNAVNNSDCKIVQFPGAQQFPAFNLTLTGMPSGIACGIENAWDIGGSAVPFGNSSATEVVSSGKNSTTGINGAAIDAPPTVPFVIPGPGPDYVCLEDDAANAFCLPPFKFDCQIGKAFDITKVNKLEIPSGFGLSTYYQEQPFRSTRAIETKHQYTPGSSLEELKSDMIGIHQNLYLLTLSWNAASFTITGPPPPGPLVCLFDQTSWNGNVLCLGPGGANLTADWQNVAQSAKMWGAKAKFYPGFYGNGAGQPQYGDIEDLAQLLYGTNQHLGNNTFAVLIQNAD